MSVISRVRTSVVVTHNDQLLCFLAKDPHSGVEYHFLPGGKIESGETAPEAAERETLEETGFQVSVWSEKNVDKEYLFHWNNQDYDCLTIFYRAKLKSPLQKTVQDADYHLGVKWIPLEDWQSYFNYNTEIREAIESLLAFE